MQRRDGDKIFHFLLYIVEGIESWNVNRVTLSFWAICHCLLLIALLLFRGMISLGVQSPELSLGNAHVRLC